jgi:hypothetical protein
MPKQWIERHRDHQAIFVAEVHQPRDEIAVVQDVVMAQRCALREPGRAAGVLDIDRIFETQFALALRERIGGHLARSREHVDPRKHAFAWRAERDDHFELRHARELQCPRHAGGDLGCDALQNLVVVGGLEDVRQHEVTATGLVQRVLEFRRLIARIDVDQNRTEFAGRELSERPFGAIGRPDADALSFRNAERHQRARQFVYPAAELRVSPPDALMTRHQRLVSTVSGNRRVQHVADCDTEQTGVGRPGCIAQFRRHFGTPNAVAASDSTFAKSVLRVD